MSTGFYSDIPLLIEVRDVKLARIIVRPDGIVKVVVPKGYDVGHLLSKKKDWILQQLSQIKQYQKIALSENFLFLWKTS